MTALALLLAQPWLEARYFFIDRTTGLPIPVLAGELEQARRDPRFHPAAQWVTLDRVRSEHWSSSPGEAFLPRTVTQLPSGPTGEVPTVAAEALGKGVRVLASAWGYPEVRAEIEVQEAGEVALHQFWFPGWRATADGVLRDIRAEPGRGRILVAVLPGDRQLQARLRSDPAAPGDRSDQRDQCARAGRARAPRAGSPDGAAAQNGTTRSRYRARASSAPTSGRSR